MAYDENLAARIRDLIGPDPELTEKKMFRGLPFLIRAHLPASATRPGGRSALWRGRDDRADPRLAPDADSRGPDVAAGLVDRLVRRLFDEVVDLGGPGGISQERGQPRLGQGLRDDVRVVAAGLVVQPG